MREDEQGSTAYTPDDAQPPAGFTPADQDAPAGLEPVDTAVSGEGTEAADEPEADPEVAAADGYHPDDVGDPVEDDPETVADTSGDHEPEHEDVEIDGLDGIDIDAIDPGSTPDDEAAAAGQGD